MLTPWQENLLWYLLRTGDYWCGPNKNMEMNESPVVLFVSGAWEDRPKLEAIRHILGGGIVRVHMEYHRGISQRDYELRWDAREYAERYLRWLNDKWENHNVIDAHNKRRYVKECLEICDAHYRHQQDNPKIA